MAHLSKNIAVLGAGGLVDQLDRLVDRVQLRAVRREGEGHEADVSRGQSARRIDPDPRLARASRADGANRA